MKIALIGATGFVGSAVLKELVDRHHDVTAIARHPEKVVTDSHVSAVAADINDVDALADLLKGHDAVISTFNAGWTNPNLYDDFLTGSKHIQEAVQKSGVKRYLIVGGAGSLYGEDGVQLVDQPGFPAEIKPGATAARDYLTYLKEDTSLDWTFLSPAIEMHAGTAGVRTGAYRVGTEHPVFNAEHRSIISVEDLAVAIVDEIENPKHIQERFTVAY